MSDVALSIALGIGLAAATGFRVFLPMLIVSAGAYTGHLPLGDSFAWLGTPSALTMLSVATIVEILAYCIPGLDNLLDTLAAPAALIAGTIVSAAVMTDVPPMVKWTAAIIAGGGIAGLTQGLTGMLRAHSTVLTGGIGNPRHRDCGARRCTPDILSGTGGAGCSNRTGHPVLVTGDTSAPPAISRGEIIGQSDVGDTGACLTLAELRYIPRQAILRCDKSVQS